MENKKVYGVYAENADITFIMEDTFNNEELKSTEVVGFVYGNEEENMDVLNRFKGKLKAEF